MAIFITGMFGSGASMLAKMLHKLGYYFGEDEDYIQKNNQCFERKDVLQVNDLVMSRFRAGWDYPKHISPEIFHRGAETQLMKYAQDSLFISDKLRRHDRWAIKDPRLCFTFPFWQHQIPNARILVCARNPIEVALHLKATRQHSIDYGKHLWSLYYQNALDITDEDNRLIILYTEFLEQPKQQAQRLVEWLGLSESDDLIEQLVSVIDNREKHYRVNDIDKHLEAPVNFSLKRIYDQLLQEAKNPPRIQTIKEQEEEILNQVDVASSTDYPKIPRRLFQYWDSNDVPLELLPMMETWRKMNAEWEYFLFNDETAQEFIRENYGYRELEAYKACALPAMKSDLFRYLVIYKQGGFYADADDKCIGAIESILDKRAEFFAHKSPKDIWRNNFFGSIAGSSVLKETIEGVLSNIEGRISQNMWIVTGAGTYSPIVQRAIKNKRLKIQALDSNEMAGKIFILSARQEYKKHGQHWSNKQKDQSIFKSQPHKDNSGNSHISGAEKISSLKDTGSDTQPIQPNNQLQSRLVILNNNLIPRKEIKLLILGHPMCGSKSLSTLLCNSGLDIGHEICKQDGMVSWSLAASKKLSPQGDGYFLHGKPANRKALMPNLLGHYLRNPMAAIPLIVIENEYMGRNNNSFKHRRSIIQRLFNVDINEFDRINAATISYVLWNKIIERYAPDFTVRIEYAKKDLSMVEELYSLTISDDMPTADSSENKFKDIQVQEVSMQDMYKGLDKQIALHLDTYFSTYS